MFSFDRLLLSFFLILLLFFPYSGKSQTQIQNVCVYACEYASQDIKYLTYNFCVTALQMNPKSRLADSEELGLIALELFKTNMILTRSYAQNLLTYNEYQSEDPFMKDDSYMKEAMKNCVKSYSEGIGKVKLATKTYKARDFRTATENLIAVFDSVSSCEDGFDERRGMVSPLKKLNHEMRAFNDLALYFTKDLSIGSIEFDYDWDDEPLYDPLD